MTEIIVGMIGVVFFGSLTVGSYLLQSDRYWHRIWLQLGQPNVNSVKELKELLNKNKAKKGA